MPVLLGSFLLSLPTSTDFLCGLTCGDKCLQFSHCLESVSLLYPVQLYGSAMVTTPHSAYILQGVADGIMVTDLIL